MTFKSDRVVNDKCFERNKKRLFSLLMHFLATVAAASKRQTTKRRKTVQLKYDSNAVAHERLDPFMARLLPVQAS